MKSLFLLIMILSLQTKFQQAFEAHHYVFAFLFAIVSGVFLTFYDKTVINDYLKKRGEL